MTKPAATSYVQVLHHLGLRTRLRVSPTLDLARAKRMADVLGAIPGMSEVMINRRTGGVLCHHDAGTDSGRIVEALKRKLDDVVVLQPGEAPPISTPSEGPSAVALSMAGAFRAMNRELLTATKGSLDLGTAAALGFMGAGAVEVGVKGNLPLPPWFNLAWWAFRTFMTFEAGPRTGAGDHGAQERTR